MNYPVKDTILIGDQLTLKFKTTLSKGESFVFPVPSNPLTQGVELVGPPVTDTISKKDGVFELESRVVITSFDSGSYKLPAFAAYKIQSDGTTDTLSFDAGSLIVRTIQIDTTSYQPFDVKGQMNYPYTLREALPWAGLLVLLFLAIWSIRRAIKNLREKKNIFGKPIVVDPPHIIALRTLEKLRAEKLWLKDQKEFFTTLTDTLRQYIEERYLLQAMEQTSNEILKDLSDKMIEKEVYRELSQLLTLSDLVKFAKYTAKELECENSLPAAIRFVNSTYMQQLEDESSNNSHKSGGK